MLFRMPSERERDWLMVIPIGALYFGLLKIMQEEKAFAVCLTVGVFYVIISREWAQKSNKRFWTIISSFVLLHVIAISLVRFPHYTGPSLAIALPLMFIDGFVMWSILRWVEKRFPGGG